MVGAKMAETPKVEETKQSESKAKAETPKVEEGIFGGPATHNNPPASLLAHDGRTDAEKKK